MVISGWMEQLTADNWTLSPTVYDYSGSFRPSDYVKGFLAESWEFTDSNTYVIHLRKGIHWQDIPPVNGREFTADDAVYHYHRLYGGGDGFTKPSPYYATVAMWQDVTSITAPDKYTVIFKWKTPNPELITETVQANGAGSDLEAPEAVKQWGDLNDWHHAIGTGPFILKDFVSASSASMVKNPNYWGYDERYPQNKLPYIDRLTILIIPDNATALAAMRTGKIDVLDSISLQNGKSMQKTNPEIMQMPLPLGSTLSIDPRVDKAPFTDIRVRKAMQMAIDLPTIASTYYGGSVSSPNPSSLTAIEMKGWGWPYEQWPQDLKDEYAYNPTAAKRLLSDAGFPTGIKTNIIVDTAADIDLLQIVKSYFTAVGIDMDIRTMESAAFSSYVTNGRKQDQLAQRSQGFLGVNYEPFRQIIKFTTGYSLNYLMVSDPVYDAFYTKANAATSIDGVKQVLRDANEYVVRQHWCVSLLEPYLLTLYQPWLKGFTGQVNALSGTGGAAATLYFFYPARFWIDTNLKKSLGH